MLENNPRNLGTVRRRGPGGFYVDWANGKSGWIDYRDTKKVSLFQPAAQQAFAADGASKAVIEVG